MNVFLRIVDGINRIVGYILAAMLGIMSILIIVQIFTRFVIEYPLHWTEELARYLMVYLVFLGAAIALRNNRLIAIEALTQALSPFLQRVLKIVVMAFTIGFAIILIVQGFEIVQAISMQKSAGLRIPMSIPYLAIPIGAILMVINAFAVLFDPNNVTEEGEGEETWL